MVSSEFENTPTTGQNNRTFAAPFLMGIAVGIGCAAAYALGRNGAFGQRVAGGLHAFEHKAVDLKDTVVEKAGQVKEAVVHRLHPTDGQPQSSLATMQEPSATATSTRKRQNQRAA
jgi:hypothetical protein